MPHFHRHPAPETVWPHLCVVCLNGICQEPTLQWQQYSWYVCEFGQENSFGIKPWGDKLQKREFQFFNVTPSTETMPTEAPAYPVDAVNRVKRLHERAAYDHATVHTILDAAALAHVAYVIDGQPYCTPTLFWREGHRLYWHGSSASRMLRHQATGVPVCVTVSHLDSLVLARCGFNHSVDYRSVMAFGHAVLVSDPDEKRKALTMMVDRFYPGRTANLRPTSDQEFKATAVMAMDIERASAKVRTKGLADEPEDQNLPIYAERIPVFTVLGAPQPCPDLTPDIARPAGLAPYQEGRRLDEALTEAHKIAYDEPH